MARTNSKTVAFDNWSKGEFGTLAPDQAPEGSWTGKNMVVYRDGHIGPRPGLFEVPLTDVPEGEIQGIGFVPTPDSEDPSVWFIIDDTVYTFRPGTAPSAVTAIATTLTTPVPEGDFIWWKESTRQLLGVTYFHHPEDGVYKLSMTAGTLELIPSSPPGKDVETYKERMFVADAGSTNTRIHMSAAADYDSWDPVEFFDVGASWPVGHMFEFRDGLAIFSNSGQWLLTGSSPATYTLRRVSETLPPLMRTLVKTHEDIFYIPVSRSAPVAYTGSVGEEQALHHLENWKAAGIDATSTHLYGNRDVIFLSADSKMLWRKNGAWTKHELEVPAGPYLVRYFDDDAVLTDGGAEGVAPKFYFLTANANAPVGIDGFSRPGDDSDAAHDAYLQVPDYFSPGGEELRVRRVLVDFTSYNHVGAPNPAFDIKVTALARFRQPGDDEVASSSWASSATAGTIQRDRHVANMGQGGYAGGFRVRLENIQGVKIDRILVDIETSEREPRS